MSTYADLKTSVDAWLARDDIAVTGSDWPQIMKIAESHIATEVRCGVQETATTLVFTDREANLPADFLEVRNPFVDDNVRTVEYLTPQALRESRSWVAGRPGMFYTIEGSSQDVTGAGDDRMKVVIAGAGTDSSPLEMDVNYYRRFPALVENSDTNWLLQNHYDVYLYSSLRAACEYVQDTELEMGYEAKFDKRVAQLNKHENRKRYGAMPKQSYGNPRAVV